MKQRILVAVVGIPALLGVLCFAPDWATMAQSGAKHNTPSSAGMPTAATKILCFMLSPYAFTPPKRRSRF